MNGLAIRGRRRLRALILGLLATGLLYLPPVSIAPRADAAWSALWSVLAPPPANEVLLLRTDDPRWATRLARIARREHAKLLITTWNAAQAAPASPAAQPGAAKPVPADGNSPAAFRELTEQQILANPSQVAGKVVIAGPAAASGPAALDPAVMAQVLASEAPDADATPALARAAGWLGAALWLSWWLWKMPRRKARRIAVAATGPAALLSLSAAAWLAAAWSVPVAGPSAWLLLTVALYNLNRRSAIGRRRQSVPAAAAAVRLAEAGRLEEAWRWYRNQAVSSALLEPLYAIASAFEKHGRRDLAAEAFYAIAQADVHFRDVPSRLLAACRAEVAPPIPHPPASPFGTLPARLSRYELLEEIGHGSAAHVFLAHDSTINRIVAVKVIDLSSRLEDEERSEAHTSFLREAETAGRLNHRGIVTVFDAGETDGHAYIAMEYSKGRRLSDFTAEKRLPAPLVLELVAQTAEALHYAHQQNVVHRDIKPANIMYDSVWDSVKITDFGIARLIDVSRTRTGVVLGTPSYMAPEQLEGENVNGHTDLFALGVSLYQLLTGQLPFQGSSMTKLMFVIANEPHRPATEIDPDLPAELNALLDTALAKSPGDRFASGAEMADALRAAGARVG